tara:strand:+ start:887 stop:2260 length:1374 start_codon:yes stop_codon:yes gene_type:complete
MKKTIRLPFFVKGIFLIIGLFFLFGIYLSIPVLFNYKSIENIIENKFFSQFNINLNINGDIKYKLLPKPHLLINNTSLSIDEYSQEAMSIDIKKLKVFLNSNSLYPKSKLNFEEFEIQDTNFLLTKKEYSILRSYFHNSQSKPIYIKKSKIFILDEQDQTLIISPIEKIVYMTSEKDNFKKLSINGNIFDLNFKSLWKKEFNSEFNSQIEIDFKEPNISIKNKLNYANISNLNGSTLINFLNRSIEVDYLLKNNFINLKSPENNNDIKIEAKIELRPFYLNSNINLNRQNFNFLVDELVFAILNLESDLIGNLNGEIKFSLTNIEHELIRNGIISFIIEEKSINLNKVKFNLSDIGTIVSEIKYDEKNGEIIFISSNVLSIKNNKNFAKKFQLNLNKIESLNKIYFKIKKNITTGIISIFDIRINELDYADKNGKLLPYNIKNSQELKSLVKRILND